MKAQLALICVVLLALQNSASAACSVGQTRFAVESTQPGSLQTESATNDVGISSTEFVLAAGTPAPPPTLKEKLIEFLLEQLAGSPGERAEAVILLLLDLLGYEFPPCM